MKLHLETVIMFFIKKKGDSYMEITVSNILYFYLIAVNVPRVILGKTSEKAYGTLEIADIPVPE